MLLASELQHLFVVQILYDGTYSSNKHCLYSLINMVYFNVLVQYILAIFVDYIVCILYIVQSTVWFQYGSSYKFQQFQFTYKIQIEFCKHLFYIHNVYIYNIDSICIYSILKQQNIFFFFCFIKYIKIIKRCSLTCIAKKNN